MQTLAHLLAVFLVFGMTACTLPATSPRQTLDFDADWRFHLGDVESGEAMDLDDADWRLLDVPHDWSIEGVFSADHPATVGGGALPGGIGWYRKAFTMPDENANQQVYIDFDGVYRNSDVWINGHHLGNRPNGYASFRYDLTPHLHAPGVTNVLAVRVANAPQPNSRWYSGSGIYRHVRLVITNPVHVDHWGTYITTPAVTDDAATVSIETTIRNTKTHDTPLTLRTIIYDGDGQEVTASTSEAMVPGDTTQVFVQTLIVQAPRRWTLDDPHRYRAVTEVICGEVVCDSYETPFGIRTFSFDSATGFTLNGEPIKIRGVCNHHDLGALGAAVNTRAMERQLEILQAMGVNGLRTAHNPPAPELLDLTDRMGFIVMDEAFDVWKQPKTTYGYHEDFDAWHQRDLEALIRRDRNHPSVFMWSIGNEIGEQWHPTGTPIAQELAAIVRRLDDTRPITAGLNETNPSNPVIQSGALDVIGFNYHLEDFETFPEVYPGQALIGSETTSALATRGHYDMPSDSLRIWPVRWDTTVVGIEGNTCSSYDNCRTPWGSTHRDAWRTVKTNDHVAGMYIWTGFDYLGEPTPYGWPSRSSYFGIVDLAGFPKDAYYLYQSEWTDALVLHVFPHWNWTDGDVVDVWAYTNADSVALFLNDTPLGVQIKDADDLNLTWRVTYAPGTLRAVGWKNGVERLSHEVHTAGPPAQIRLSPDRSTLHADGNDLSFVTVEIVDDNGVLVPDASHRLHFAVEGPATIAAVDNGSPTSHEPFQADYRHAFNGKALVIVRTMKTPGPVTLRVTADGLEAATRTLRVQ